MFHALRGALGYRYLGNKTNLAPWIVEVASSIVTRGATVADLMCGTASVAEAFARAHYSVHAADELRFPGVHARVRLRKTQPKFGRFAKGYAGALRALNMARPRKRLFHREYSPGGTPNGRFRPRSYFSPENAAKIDGIRATIAEWRDEGRITSSETELLLHDLILAVNDVANIAGTYGYFRSGWNRSSLAPLVLKQTAFCWTPGTHRVSQGKVETLIKTVEADLCYLDPPYTKRQYAGQYHIPETLALGDEPKPVGEGGLRDWYPNSSAFCSKRHVEQAFREVLGRSTVEHLLISYSEDGLLGADVMRDLFSQFGQVTCYTKSRSRYRSNGGKSEPLHEYLYHVRRR